MKANMTLEKEKERPVTGGGNSFTTLREMENNNSMSYKWLLQRGTRGKNHKITGIGKRDLRNDVAQPLLFVHEEPEAQKGQTTCLRSHS